MAMHTVRLPATVLAARCGSSCPRTQDLLLALPLGAVFEECSLVRVRHGHQQDHSVGFFFIFFYFFYLIINRMQPIKIMAMYTPAPVHCPTRRRLVVAPPPRPAYSQHEYRTTPSFLTKSRSFRRPPASCRCASASSSPSLISPSNISLWTSSSALSGPPFVPHLW
jgi:hypothetical protein